MTPTEKHNFIREKLGVGNPSTRTLNKRERYENLLTYLYHLDKRILD